MSADFTLSKLALLAGVFAMASCAMRPQLPPPPPEPVNPEDTYSYWDDRTDGTGKIRVKIDLSEQTAYITRGGTLIGRSRVATGTPGHSTPTGSFTITEKVVDKRSNLYGQMLDASGNVVISDASIRKHAVPKGGRFLGAPMPYWMRLTSYGVGMHHGPIPNPGYPASHGCIRMRLHMAEALFANAPIGTPVTIVP